MASVFNNTYVFSEDNKQKFAERLIKLRKKNKKSQESIAERIGITQQTYGNYESGKRLPSIDILYSLAKLYNVPSDFLIGITDSDKNDKDIQTAVDLLGLSDKSVETLLSENNASMPENWVVSTMDCLNMFIEHDAFESAALLAVQLRSLTEQFDNEVVLSLRDSIIKGEKWDGANYEELNKFSDTIELKSFQFNKLISRIIDNTLTIMFENAKLLLNSEFSLITKDEIDNKERIKRLNNIIEEMKEKNIWESEKMNTDNENCVEQ